MTDKKDDVILNEEDQKLSEDEKQNYETSWNSDSKSGTATGKGAKLPEVKSTTPVAEEKQADPSTSRTTVTVKDAATDAEATGKVEDKANRIRDSLKAKTDTTATGKSINQFQVGEKNTFEEENNAKFAELDQKNQEAKNAADKVEQKRNFIEENTAKWNNLKKEAEAKAKAAKETKEATQDLIESLAELTESPAKALFNRSEISELKSKMVEDAKNYGLNLNPKGNVQDIARKYTDAVKTKCDKDIESADHFIANADKAQKIAQEEYTNAVIVNQKAQNDYAKAKQEYTTWKTKYWTADAKAKEEAAEKTKAEEKEAETEKKAETENKKDETKDPLEKAEKLEQPRAPADIKKFSNDLNRFVIQAYLNGDFGKKSSPNAIASMGFFILDKLGTALVNASEVARGLSPSAKSQWSNVLDVQTDLLGKRITAEWFLSQPREKQEALIRSGVISGVSSASTIYNTVDPNAVSRAEQRDILEISKLSQEQKGVAQSNVNALLARKSELQTLITQLKSDQGWEVYAQAMNAVVGTAKGLSSLGVTDSSDSSSQKGFSDTLSANVSTGSVTKAFVSGGVSNKSSWNNSSAETLSKSSSLSQDALAVSKFESGEAYAKATREAKKEANEQLIRRLEGQIEIIDKCIDSWGKDLGL